MKLIRYAIKDVQGSKKLRKNSVKRDEIHFIQSLDWVYLPINFTAMPDTDNQHNQLLMLDFVADTPNGRRGVCGSAKSTMIR
jgi:hypothetical protein